MFARYARPGWSVWGNESDEDITPQGKAQRGYGGGDIESLPHLEPNERMSDWLSDRVAQIMADEYAKGMSSSADFDSIGLLHHSGAEALGQGWRGAARAGAS